jgi:hypothetical protein
VQLPLGSKLEEEARDAQWRDGEERLSGRGIHNVASHGEATTSRDHNISRNTHRDGEGRGWLGVRQWRYSSVAIFGSTTKPAGIIISPLYLAGEI